MPQVVASDFRPHSLLKGPHLQTLAGFVLGKRIQVQYQRQRLELNDGDFLDLDWGKASNGLLPEDAPLLLLIHGLEGCSGSHYIKAISRQALEQNIQPVVLNMRSCSGQPNRLPRMYHSGDTGDIDRVLRHFQARLPNRARFACGISLGGNQLVKYLGEQADAALLNGACAVSVPFWLAESGRRINSGISQIYSNYLLKSLKKKLTKRTDLNGVTPELLKNIKNFYQFDHQITAPIHGFSGMYDYYSQSSSLPFIKTITKPTLLIQALDDPFMTEAVIPRLHHLSETVILELAEHGGHAGFIGAGGEFWMAKRVVEWLSLVI
ncbi:hydrolase [Pelagibaculum spongiae]|uniref:Hydrolase n=1 Tax=Pelagibaculum spongiae TaxID=2080658 RepID=A0A2V1GSZ0_9GAMM|nr:hydrolase [Pelagibaculum spongiae]PVZ68412.1 hydrolase [Pelagibaculum spongiae]